MKSCKGSTILFPNCLSNYAPRSVLHCPHLEKHNFSEAMIHYESTSFNAKPMELQEKPDNLVFPNDVQEKFEHLHLSANMHMKFIESDFFHECIQ